MAVVTGKYGIRYVFRKPVRTDVALLARYFSLLSETTKTRFAPHALTQEYANRLCQFKPDSAETNHAFHYGRLLEADDNPPSHLTRTFVRFEHKLPHGQLFFERV